MISDRVEAAHRTAVANLIEIDGKLMERGTRLNELPQYNVGEWVLIYDPTGREKRSSKLLLRWTGPYRIVKRSSAVNYTVSIVTPTKRQHNRIKKVHVYRMRRYTQREAINDNTIDRSSCWLIREYAGDTDTAANDNSNVTALSDGPAPSDKHHESPSSIEPYQITNADNDRQVPSVVNNAASPDWPAQSDNTKHH